jgi:hypothetical protein
MQVDDAPMTQVIESTVIKPQDNTGIELRVGWR